MRLSQRPPTNARPGSRPLGVPSRRPSHPGLFLDRHYLRPLGLNQTQAARLLGISRRRLNELVQGQRAMTADTALRCALVFHTDSTFWLAQQSAWDIFHHWQNVSGAEASRPPLFQP